MQSITGLVYLFARLERGGGGGLSETGCRTVSGFRDRFRGLFDNATGDAEVLLFRLGQTGPATARSLRRPLDEVLTIS